MRSIDELPETLATPCLVVDATVVGANLARMADYCREHGLNLRPHTKTHKSKHVATLQRQTGAAGLTVAKAGEAEVMAEVADDVLVAYPVVDLVRAHRLAQLAWHKTVRVGVDSVEAAATLATAAADAEATLGVLVDVDVGFHRTGVQSPEEALRLAVEIARRPSLRLDGLMCFPGHIGGPASEQPPALRRLNEVLVSIVDLWREKGLEAKIFSGGSTPTAYRSHVCAVLNEIRPGTYVYNDATQLHGGYATLDDCAARVVCTVVSTAVRGKVVVDAGSKALTSDRCATRPDSGYGIVVEYPQATVTRLSEEHGEIDVTSSDRRPKVGERVSIIPNHICPCVNLVDRFWWWEADGTLVELPVDARGMLS